MPSSSDPKTVVQPGPGRLPANTVPTGALITPGGSNSGAALEAHITDPIDAHDASAISTASATSSWITALEGLDTRTIYVVDGNGANNEKDFPSLISAVTAVAGTHSTLLLRAGSTYTYDDRASTNLDNVVIIGEDPTVRIETAGGLDINIGENTVLKGLQIYADGTLVLNGDRAQILNCQVGAGTNQVTVTGEECVLDGVSPVTVTSLFLDVSSSNTLRNLTDCAILLSGDRNVVKGLTTSSVDTTTRDVVRIVGTDNEVEDVVVSGTLIASWNAGALEILGNRNRVRSFTVDGLTSPVSSTLISVFSGTTSCHLSEIHINSYTTSTALLLLFTGKSNTLEGYHLSNVTVTNTKLASIAIGSGLTLKKVRVEDLTVTAAASTVFEISSSADNCAIQDVEIVGGTDLAGNLFELESANSKLQKVNVTNLVTPASTFRLLSCTGANCSIDTIRLSGIADASSMTSSLVFFSTGCDGSSVRNLQLDSITNGAMGVLDHTAGIGVSIEDVQLTSITTSGQLVYSNARGFSASNVHIEGCTALRVSLFTGGSNSVTLSNVRILSTSTTLEGFYVNSHDTTIDGLKMESITATNAVLVLGGDRISMVNSKFLDSTGSEGLIVLGNGITVDNCHMDNVDCTNQVLFVDGSERCRIDNLYVVNSTSTGVDISSTSEYVTITNSEWHGTDTVVNGESVVFNNVYVNFATQALTLNTAKADFHDCTFSGWTGRVIAAANSGATFDGCVFSGGGTYNTTMQLFYGYGRAGGRPLVLRNCRMTYGNGSVAAAGEGDGTPVIFLGGLSSGAITDHGSIVIDGLTVAPVAVTSLHRDDFMLIDAEDLGPGEYVEVNNLTIEFDEEIWNNTGASRGEQTTDSAAVLRLRGVSSATSQRASASNISLLGLKEGTIVDERKIVHAEGWTIDGLTVDGPSTHGTGSFTTPATEGLIYFNKCKVDNVNIFPTSPLKSPTVPSVLLDSNTNMRGGEIRWDYFTGSATALYALEVENTCRVAGLVVNTINGTFTAAVRLQGFSAQDAVMTDCRIYNSAVVDTIVSLGGGSKFLDNMVESNVVTAASLHLDTDDLVADPVVVKGNRLRAAGTAGVDGFRIRADNSIITNNVIHLGNDTGVGIGVEADNVVVSDNVFKQAEWSICVRIDSNHTNCVISGNSGTDTDVTTRSFVTDFGDYTTITGNTYEGHDPSMRVGGYGTITGNVIKGTAGATMDVPGAGSIGSTATGNVLRSDGGGGTAVLNVSAPSIASNNLVSS